MSAPAATPPHLLLQPEWLRVEVLCHCLSESRQGRKVGEDVLGRLRELQDRVEEGRRNGAWSAVADAPLTPLEYDVLACVLAPEAEPRLGWHFQNLQPGSPQPYPTPALLRDLLVLDGTGVGDLHDTLSDRGMLSRARLVECDCGEAYRAVRARPGTVARLMGWQHREPAPPGSVEVRTEATWEELVLPPDRVTMLNEFLHWVRHRDTVVGDWGGLDCGGPVALFSGPSGTGKTFAASVLATDLGWPLFRVDLGRLISKYIGETEKNLNRLFDSAHGREMILQFDEADSVFGRRGETKDARDRYANMEVSHLLARIEAHRGPCILTTNLRGNLDPAFARRFHVVVEFARPDPAARARLWDLLLPPRAPGRESLDTALLGRAANLTGGGIRNAALHAAHLAAAAGGDLGLDHITLAIWRELGKDGRELTRAALGELAPHLPEDREC